MNYGVALQLKEIYQKTGDLLNYISDNSNMGLSEPLGKVLGLNLMRFTFGIIASDGIVNDDEAQFIATIFSDLLYGYGLEGSINKDSLVGIIQAVGTEDEVPAVIQITVKIDEALRAQGDDGTISESVISTFETFGEQIMMADGREDPRERRVFNNSINAMRRYVNTHL